MVYASQVRVLLMAAAGLATAGAISYVGWGLPGIAMAGPRAGGRIARLVPQVEVTLLFLIGIPVWARMFRAARSRAFRRALAATVRGPGHAAWTAAGIHAGSAAQLLGAGTLVWTLASTPLAVAPVISVVGARSEVIHASMLLNPWIVTAGLSGFDILRTQWVYALSPLGSLEAPYPGLELAATAYGGAGFLLLLLALLALRASRVGHRGHA